jgi:hypothetical protein
MSEFKNTTDRCNAIEACYELMLAYAAQGILDDKESGNGSQLRQLLARAVEAVTNISKAYAQLSDSMRSDEQKIAFEGFLATLALDAEKAHTAMTLVLVQPRISSQLIDNLNASIHIRALLTDLFLLEEICVMHTPKSGL